ncbi:MBL fold metallo-hydrolase [Sandaracinobacteroides hominis]|uniref:MBL fold metallo-hydrolase n=1 Tax=Sandaracinobacteroides hominis TaxID=2780086 RepID=UPI0018F431B0|nr:MBL fold metallo-hydrolase [Sandaracinobacteroides hominis]
MKKWLLGAVAVVALGAGAGWAFREPLALMLYARGAEQALTSNNLDGLPDGLHAAFCGTGSPMPDPDRAGPCLAVIAGKRLLIVDAGEGAARNLQLMGLPPGRVERVLLTHFHSDHIDGLGALALQRWVGSSATAQLPLLGPVGVGQIAAGFNAVYQPDSTYRVAHHGEAVVPPSGFGLSPRAFAVPETTAVISDDGGLKVTAIRVDHRPVAPAVGYRFDYKGRCLTVSGDTVVSPVLMRAAEACDLLVHEALQPRLTRVLGEAAKKAGNAPLAKVMADIEDYHTTPEQAAEVAQKAGAKMLVLTHIVPPLRLAGLEGAFLGDARKRFDGEIRIAQDRDLVSLPATGGIETSRLGGTR